MKARDERAAGDFEDRILVVRFSSLGDILLAAPALRALRARFPQAWVDLLVASEYADAARLLTGPDRVLTFDRREGLPGLLRLCRSLSRRYTLLVDLQNSLRSALLRTLSFPVLWVKAKRYRCRRWLLIHLKWNTYGRVRPVAVRYLDAMAAIGAQDDGCGLDLVVPQHARAWARGLLQSDSAVSLAVLCPGARHFTKRWPLERWSQLGRELRADGWRVAVAGSADERDVVAAAAGEIPDAFIVCGHPLPDMAALFEQAAVVVSNDSGLMHLAAGVGTRVVALFGPTVPEFGFCPFRARSEVMENRMSCRPCSAFGGPRCPEKHFRCMLDTESARVAAAVRRLATGDEA